MAHRSPQERRGDHVQPRPLIFSVAQSAGTVGLGTGLAGVAIGGAAGLFRSTTPGIFAIASGIQCFTLGSSFIAARSASLEFISQIEKRPILELSGSDRLLSSTFGGAGAGALTATLFRGRANVLPGLLVWGAIGWGGQALYEATARENGTQTNPAASSFIDRITSSKCSPMTKLSDEQYETMLKERLIRVEAELAIVNEDIARLSQDAQHDC